MKILSILLVCFVSSLSAQEIQVGDFFNNLGSLRNESKEWKTNEFPLKLVLMYYNGNTTINGNRMSWLIEPDKNSGLPVDNVGLVVGQGRSWAAVKYDFTLPGTYTITAYDREKHSMATTRITIDGPKKVVEKPKPANPKPVAEKKPEKVEMKPVETKPRSAQITKKELLENAPEPVFVESNIKEELTEEEKETLVYESFYMAFGRSVKSGMLMGQNEKFKAVAGGNYVEVLFSNNEGFTEEVNVDVWLRPKGGKEHNEHVLDKRVKVPKGHTQSNFHLTLRQKGSYKVSLFDEDDTWIGSSYVALY